MLVNDDVCKDHLTALRLGLFTPIAQLVWSRSHVNRRITADFPERGEHELKGVPDKWAIYAVRS